MISYYFEKEDYANAVKVFKNNEVKIRNANFNTKDIELIRNLSLY